MKRSEMLKIIKQAMSLNRIGRICYPDPLAAPEYVLKAIEDAGMLPPSNDVILHKYRTEEIYEWESE